MLAEQHPPVLETRDLGAGYGQRTVLRSVDLRVDAGEVVALVGHNGAGKSTLLKVVFGLLTPWHGEVRVGGVHMQHATPCSMVKRGVALVEQGQRVFGDLTVRENLEVRGVSLGRSDLRARIAAACELFPSLQSKLKAPARTLSGGEKQMLSVAGALLTRPRLVLLDEPTLGLAPLLVSSLLHTVYEACREARSAAVLVEHRIAEALNASDRVYLLRNGVVQYRGDSRTTNLEQLLRESCFTEEEESA